MTVPLRNIAVIAHVDHGKTTLIDCLLRQSGAFHENEQVRDRVMDSYELERERGITIFAKNAALAHRGVKINIIDTPGHADFGGEVERALHMASGALLLVDAFEGPMPQTRFVVRKALAQGIEAVVAINKMDRAGADPDAALNRVFDLFVDLGASDEQLDFSVVYTSATAGWARREPDDDNQDMTPLLDTLLDSLPAPEGDPDDPFRMLVSNIDYNDYVGRIAIGRISSGRVRAGMRVFQLADGVATAGTMDRAYEFHFVGRRELGESAAEAGDIVAVTGFPDVTVGHTLAETADAEPFPQPEIDPPTLSMEFSVNTSPFAGQEGKYVTSRHLKARLHRECGANVALRVEATDAPDVMHVSGRGILHLSILIEQMRREGHEFEVSRPQVIFREENGVVTEPVENVTVEVPNEFLGAVMELLGARGGVMKALEESGRFSRGRFVMPSRGLIGIRSRMMSATRGEAVLYHTVCGHEPVRSEPHDRTGGLLVASHTGEVTGYALMNLQDRGRYHVQPGDAVYEGMIVGETAKPGDIALNVTRAKHLTNVRSSTKELTEKLNAPLQLGLEDALEMIVDDELVEVTPKSFRMRKRILQEKARLRVERRTRKSVGPRDG